MKKSAALLTLIAGVFLFLNGTAPSVYIIGDKAENFTLKNVNEKMVALDDYPNANGYIIVFTCNHCPYAQSYEQRIINLHKKYTPLGYPVIAINPNDPIAVPEDNFDEMKKRAKEKKYAFPYLFDEEQAVYPKFGATRTPHVFVLDKNRVVRYIGAIDDSPESASTVTKKYVEDALTALINGQKPNPDYTRAVGCTIKKKGE